MASCKKSTTANTIPYVEGVYSSESLKDATLPDGTKVITTVNANIKRPICAGIDVHKSTLMAAVCVTDHDSLDAIFYVKPFSTSNSDIRRMADWLLLYNAVDVCMESTGKYWIPVFDILEQNGLSPVLTHPKYVKQAKGRKTDFRDAIHIASLFRMDLVVPSFIPPADIRDMRELCRYRIKLTYMRTSEKNRYQNSMTVSKVRLDSVLTDPFGKTACDIMHYLVTTSREEVNDEMITSFIRQQVKADPETILDSIHGYEFIGAQRDKLEIIQLHLEDIDKYIKMIDNKLEYYRIKYDKIIRHLMTMIGISQESALYILAEIGADMSVWRDCRALVNWVGLSPANNESANKKKSTKIGSGGHYLKPLLIQCALAAIKSTKKNPYFYYKYLNIKKRRGQKKAIIAIARKMLVSIYHMIKDDKDFMPIDNEQVVTKQKPNKELNLSNVIAFLGEHGVDANTIRIVEAQCSQRASENGASGSAAVLQNKKEKQSESNTEPIPAEQKPAKRRGRPPKSHQTKAQPLDQPTDATA